MRQKNGNLKIAPPKTPIRGATWTWSARIAFCILAASVTARPALAADTFSDDLTHLTGFAHTIEGDEREIKELIERKHATEDKQQLEEIIGELVKKHVELAKASQDYEQLRLHIRFKHPEKNETVERKYVHYKLKTLTEMEGSFGLDGRLDRTKSHVLATFPLPETEKTATRESVFAKGRQPASVEGGQGEAKASADAQEDMPGRILLRK